MKQGNPRFGSYIKSLRQGRRLTLERVEELTARLGDPVSKTYLSRCEHGQTHPSLPRLEVLARVYRIRLGELAERFDVEQELIRRDTTDAAPARAVVGPGPGAVAPEEAGQCFQAVDAAEEGIEAARRGDPQGALVLFDASRRLLPPPAAKPAESDDSGIQSLAAEPGAMPAAHPAPAAHLFPDPGRLAAARSRLCLAVLSSSLGNFHLCKDEAESLVCAEDLPDEIRMRAAVQLALAYRKLRRSTLARLVVTDLLSRGDALAPRIQADAHFLMGTLDLDAGSPRPALLHLRKAVSLYKVANDQTDLCRALQELGEAYRLGGQLPEAIARYQEGLMIARRADIKSLTADLLSHLGRAHFQRGASPVALRYFFESNDLARRGDYFEILFRNHFYMRAIAKSQGDEFSRRGAERSLRMLLPRCDPLTEEAIGFAHEIGSSQPEAEATGGSVAPSPPLDEAESPRPAVSFRVVIGGRKPSFPAGTSGAIGGPKGPSDGGPDECS